MTVFHIIKSYINTWCGFDLSSQLPLHFHFLRLFLYLLSIRHSGARNPTHDCSPGMLSAHSDQEQRNSCRVMNQLAPIYSRIHSIEMTDPTPANPDGSGGQNWEKEPSFAPLFLSLTLGLSYFDACVLNRLLSCLSHYFFFNEIFVSPRKFVIGFLFVGKTASLVVISLTASPPNTTQTVSFPPQSPIKN